MTIELTSVDCSGGCCEGCGGSCSDGTCTCDCCGK